MTKEIKYLNLYAGLGGNRKLLPEHVKVTAVEKNETIAAYYQDQYPDDVVIVADAHDFLLKYYREFPFVWSSISCPTHSQARFWNASGGGVMWCTLI